jgi:hypothetical protein
MNPLKATHQRGNSLKGQCHEIFDSRFFHQSTPYRSLINRLKPFRRWLRIRRENRFESREFFFSEFPNFFCLKYRYSMGMLTYETFLLDVLFKKSCGPVKTI